MRPYIFRTLAVLLGLCPFAMLELLLSVFQPRMSAPLAHESHVRFRATRPLFCLNSDQQRYEISSDRQPFFQPDGFATPKSPTEFRVFCLGGSTVQGRPYGIDTSFTTWLELSLNELNSWPLDEDHTYQVVNCGGVSYASYRLIPILAEVLHHEPDLLIVYTGHNEFLENHWKNRSSTPELNIWGAQWLAHSHVYSCLVRITNRRAHNLSLRPILKTEVDALLDYEGGLCHYHRDNAWRMRVIKEYRNNLQRLVELAEEARVPLILINPVSNLSDCPPFKVQHRDQLGPDELQHWNALMGTARELIASEPRKAIALLDQALRIDDQHAGLHYVLGVCHESLGDYQQAQMQYHSAKENDICPLRMLEAMHDSLQKLAASTDTPLVDACKLFTEHSPNGMCGSSLLLDHVHPTIEGHQLLAFQLVNKMVNLRMIAPPGKNWRSRVAIRSAAHLEALDARYFDHGQLRLENLRAWTQGRAKKTRVGETATIP